MARLAKDPAVRSHQELADRAARVAAILDRWEAEDVSGEPEWSVEELEPVTFRRSSADHEKRQT
jgi:hypothetical protein